MEIYISVNSEGYVDGYSSSEVNPGHKIQIKEDDLFFQRGFASYKFVSGQLVFDEEEDNQIQTEKHLRESMPSVEEQLITTQAALADMYEQNNNIQQQLIDTQLAMVEMFEGTL